MPAENSLTSTTWNPWDGTSYASNSTDLIEFSYSLLGFTPSSSDSYKSTSGDIFKVYIDGVRIYRAHDATYASGTGFLEDGETTTTLNSIFQANGTTTTAATFSNTTDAVWVIDTTEQVVRVSKSAVLATVLYRVEASSGLYSSGFDSSGTANGDITFDNTTIIELRRSAQNESSPSVDFSNASILTEQDLDNSSLNVFHMAQQAIVTAEKGVVFDAGAGTWDAQQDGVDKKIRGVLAGTASNDVTTVGQFDTHDAAIEQQKVTTLAYREDTEDYKLEAGDWAQKADGQVKVYTDNSRTGGDLGHSAKAHASVVGTHAPSTGSAKEWAQTTGVPIDSTYSAKEYAQGTTVAAGGSAKSWANTLTTLIDGSEYSAKEYAIGTQTPVGSAKDWAVLPEDSVVTGSSYSALHHATKAAASAATAAATAVEGVEDVVGLMFDSNTETGITATYVDNGTGAGKINLAVGNAPTATTATTATNVTIVADNTSNTTNYLLFSEGSVGGNRLESDTGLTYNPSTGLLTSTTFVGALTGNATTATALATSRQIGGVGFNGTANIDLPGVNTSGNQATSGNAATASDLSADNIVDEANLKISNAGSNGQFLSKQSGNAGGLTWATATSYTAPTIGSTLIASGSTNATLAGLTLTSPVLNTGVSGSAVLNESNLGSNSSTKLATQASIKAYVDGQIHSSNSFDIFCDQSNRDTFTLGATLHFYGGSGLTSTVTNDTVHYALDNLTGHITSSGSATTLGSFTVAQLSSALSNASISGNNTGDQTIPTDFVSAASGGTFADDVVISHSSSGFDANSHLTLSNLNDTADDYTGILFQARSASEGKGWFGFERTLNYGRGDFVFLLDTATDDNAVAITDEVCRITSAGAGVVGSIAIGNSNAQGYFAGARNLIVGDHTNEHGITICSKSDEQGRIAFADSTGSANDHQGLIEFDHNTNYMNIKSANFMNLYASSTLGLKIRTTAGMMELKDNKIHFNSSGGIMYCAGGTSTGSASFQLNFTWNTGGYQPIHVFAMHSHWTAAYGTIRESYIHGDSYAGMTEHNQYNSTGSIVGSWTFSRPSNNTLRLTKNAGSGAQPIGWNVWVKHGGVDTLFRT